MTISHNDKVEDMTTNMCRFSHVLFKISLLKEFSQVASITGSIITVVHNKIPQYYAIGLVCGRITALYQCGERRTVNRGDGGSIPPTAVSKLRQFTPHLPVCFGRDTKSRWSLLSGVYARGSKISHTGGKCVTRSGLINSTKEQLLR